MTENCALLERIGIITGRKEIGLGAISDGRGLRLKMVERWGGAGRKRER